MSDKNTAAADTKTTENKTTENKAADVKSTIEQMMGAWAMPNLNNLPQMPNLKDLPGMQAFQAVTQQQVEQLEKMVDEYTKHETKAMEQARVWMSEMTRLNQASMEYALSLQNETRKLWRQQIHQVAQQVGKVGPQA